MPNIQVSNERGTVRICVLDVSNSRIPVTVIVIGQDGSTSGNSPFTFNNKENLGRGLRLVRLIARNHYLYNTENCFKITLFRKNVN